VESKRRCKKCNTLLSSYNKGEYCYRHTPGTAIKKLTPVSDCYSYTGKVRDKKNIPKPGDPEYNDIAFTEEVVGYVDEDGNIKPIEELLKQEEN